MSRNPLLDWRAVGVSSFAVGFRFDGGLQAFSHALSAAQAPWVQTREHNERWSSYLVLRPTREQRGVIRVMPRAGILVANASLRRLPGDGQPAITEANLMKLVRWVGGSEVRSVPSLESSLENPRLETMRLAVYRTRSAGRAMGTSPLTFVGTLAELVARARAVTPWTWTEHATYVTASVMPAPHTGYVQLVHADVCRATWYFEAMSTSDTPCAPTRGKALVEAAQREALALIEAWR